MSLDRYPPGGCVLTDKTRCTLSPFECCDHGLLTRWPGDHKATDGGTCQVCDPQRFPCAVVRAVELRARLAPAIPHNTRRTT
jgi:hypothetical protein